MNTEKLLKTIPIIQNQMDVLLDFNVSVSALAKLGVFKIDASVGPDSGLFLFTRSTLMS